MPRITSGIAKNRNIEIPEIDNIRVAQDVYKMSLFAIIGDRITDATCLDLFAGSGSFGLEALSRGAKSCDFVDESRRACQTIQENLKNMSLEGGEVFQDSAVKFAANTANTYDIVFMDPFYDDTKHKFLLKNLEEILNPNGVVAFSHGEGIKITEQIEGTNFKIDTERRFGRSYLTMLVSGLVSEQR